MDVQNDRVIRFQGIRNCRDLGGLTVEDGRQIRRGRLLRSAHLGEATQEDIQALQQHNLVMIVDLRTSEEQFERPDCEVPGAVHRPMPVFENAEAGITHERGMAKRLRRMPPDMRELYRSAILDDTLRSNLGEALRILIRRNLEDHESAILWHCTEGKDRCGILSASILLALGATRETVMEDYILTNATSAARAQAYYERTLAEGFDERAARIVYGAMIADERYMEAVFEEIDRRYGDDCGFLREGLAVPEELLEAFRQEMLVSM